MIDYKALLLTLFLNVIAGSAMAASNVALPSIYAVAGNKIEKLPSPHEGTAATLDVIRLYLQPNDVLTDHASGKRIIIVESPLSILRLADQTKGQLDNIIQVEEDKAFWLENTKSAGFRHVGTSTTSYIAILWPSTAATLRHDSSTQTTAQTSLNESVCSVQTTLLNNAHARVCMANNDVLTAEILKQLDNQNWIRISKNNQPEMNYLIYVR